MKTGAVLTLNWYVYVWWKCTKGQQGDGINNVKADSTPQKVIRLKRLNN